MVTAIQQKTILLNGNDFKTKVKYIIKKPINKAKTLYLIATQKYL
jgi:hypothetical protein